MLVVCVVVIDCTLTCESLPTPTLPTVICRVLRRGASTGGTFGSPRLIAATEPAYFAGLWVCPESRLLPRERESALGESGLEDADGLLPHPVHREQLAPRECGDLLKSRDPRREQRTAGGPAGRR